MVIHCCRDYQWFLYMEIQLNTRINITLRSCVTLQHQASVMKIITPTSPDGGSIEVSPIRREDLGKVLIRCLPDATESRCFC
jgi:hypothetical protein